MAKDIVTTELLENIAKELRVDDKGRIYTSKKGLARLLGVTAAAIGQFVRVNGIEPEETEILDPPVFVGVNGIVLLTESQVRKTAKHFAFKSRKTTDKAEQFYDFIAAVGWRTAGQKILGYQAIEKRTLSQGEIIELCCLPVPSDWQRRFPEQYYDQLSRLTDLKAFGNSRPGIWAKYTKELVYDYLPVGVYNEIKRCKEETGSYEKLHQFLAEDGLKILEQHQRTLLTLMSASSSLSHLKTLINQSCTGNYQLLLLER